MSTISLDDFVLRLQTAAGLAQDALAARERSRVARDLLLDGQSNVEAETWCLKVDMTPPGGGAPRTGSLKVSVGCHEGWFGEGQISYAGPGAVERWLGQRGQLEPDFFIASIPFKETREYVARVLAFSVIYDWRMHGKALSVAGRLPRYGQAYAAPGRDAPRKAVVCPTADTAQVAPAAVAPAPGA